MKSIQRKVFSYHEISPYAQNRAYTDFLAAMSKPELPFEDIQHVIDTIKARAEVGVYGWECDESGYLYKLDDLEMVMRPEFDSYNFEHDVLAAAEPSGIRAGKIAMRIFHQITMADDLTVSRTSPPNESSLQFTDVWFSKVFSVALKASIRKNYTDRSYTLEAHLKKAYDAMFQAIIDNHNKVISIEEFAGSFARDNEYHRNGSLFVEQVGEIVL